MINNEKKNATNRAYYHRNKQRILEDLRSRYTNNENGVADRIKTTGKKYRKLNKEKIKYSKSIEKEKNKVRYSLYYRWKNMMNRCRTPEDKDFKNYGARGIKVIFPLDDFNSYKDHILSLIENPEDIFGMHIDRIDNNSNYEIGNLRVISVAENLENSRNIKNNPKLKRSKKCLTHSSHAAANN